MNLIQLQDELQNLPLQNVMQYANGSNPEVPGYMALAELNRRKQIEQQYQAFQNAGVQQPTVKQQLENSLARPPQMVNPAAAPNIVNPAAAQQQVQMAQAPEGADVTQRMAEGGIPSISPYVSQSSDYDYVDPDNVPHQGAPLESERGISTVPVGMFNSNSFAGGGIVAFANNPDQPVDPDMESTDDANAREDARLAAIQPKTDMTVNQATAPVAPRAAAPAPAQAKGFTPQGIEDLIAEKELLDKRFGISQDPFAEAKKLQAAKELRQEAKYAQDPMDRLIAQLTGIAKADPTKGFGAHMAAGAEASQLLKKEQELYRDKADDASIAFAHSVAKEEDARKRGDVAGIQKAKHEQDKLAVDWSNANSKALEAQAAMSKAGAAWAGVGQSDKLNAAHADWYAAQAEALRASNKGDLTEAKIKKLRESNEQVKYAFKMAENMTLKPEEQSVWGQYAADLITALGNGTQPPLPPKQEKYTIERNWVSPNKEGYRWVGQYNSAPSAPPAAAVNMLRQDPSLRDAFDAKYGAGSAARILGK